MHGSDCPIVWSLVSLISSYTHGGKERARERERENELISETKLFLDIVRSWYSLRLTHRNKAHLETIAYLDVGR